jgi:Crinkler effector protein N-terminal domain
MDDLKDAIKQKKANDLQDIDADRLELYLAMVGYTWLETNIPVVKELK